VKKKGKELKKTLNKYSLNELRVLNFPHPSPTSFITLGRWRGQAETPLNPLSWDLLRSQWSLGSFRNSSTLYGTQRFNVVLTRACDRPLLPWVWRIQSLSQPFYVSLDIPTYTYVLQVVSSLEVFWQKCCKHFTYSPCTLHVILIPSLWQYFVKSVHYEALHYVTLQSSVTSSPLCSNMFKNFFQTPSIYVLPLQLKTTFHIHTQWHTKLYFVHFNPHIFREGKGKSWVLLYVNMHFPNLACSLFSQVLQLWNIIKGFPSYHYVMILSWIPEMRHEHTLCFICIYFETNLLTTFNSFCVTLCEW